MRMLAKVARQYASSTLHVTTRQDVQLHRVRLGDIYRALVELYSRA